MSSLISEWVVAPDEGNARLDKFVAARRGDLSRSFIQGLISDGYVRVGALARKANYAVKPGERVTLELPPPETTVHTAENIPLDVLFEDEDLLVVNKPAGMVVHPAAGHAAGTVVNAVLAHAPEIVTGNTERPGIVHRLDRDTSGVLVIAKTDHAMHEVQRQFAAREVDKTYLALVQGRVAVPQGKIDAPLARDPRDRKKIAVTTGGQARSAVTDFRVLAQNERYTYLEVKPETGRTHQIRVHLAFLKHPVVGDVTYGRKKNGLGLARQFLHAARVRLKHPTTHEFVEFSAPLPVELTTALERAAITA